MENRWRFQRAPPLWKRLSFYNEYIGKDLTNGYVMLMNDPTREYYKLYEIDYDRHMYDGYNWRYVNLPVEDIKKMAIASIKDSTAMFLVM